MLMDESELVVLVSTLKGLIKYERVKEVVERPSCGTEDQVEGMNYLLLLHTPSEQVRWSERPLASS